MLHEAWPQYMRATTMAIRGLYSTPSPDKFNSPTKKTKERLFTPEQLKKYDGRDGNRGPYLALLGRVRAFVSGDFTEAGLNDDVSGLTSADYIGLDDWVKFYDKDYKYVGKLIGRYYDEKGEPTSYYFDLQRWISESYSHRDSEDKEKKMFPPCNSEWSADSGSRVWCTKRSGGVQRDWAGVPRKLYSPGQPKPRCACVKGFGAPSHDPNRMPHDNRGDLDNPHVEEYAGCETDQPVCLIKED
ncbi:Neuferricin-like [Homarus americanus]|uniref:Neuferricin-like n=1 Tax=Homarus americanus TaxID=6706 RepID=A0A8J5TH72_HOMAM|nr:Neuferricin-like [Homarus americanus]